MRHRELSYALAALALCAAQEGFADEAPRPTKTSTRAKALSKEDRELAEYLDVLENYELLEQWELINVMPALEDDDAR